MGILNVTKDSFSDGGRYLDPSIAIQHAEAMVDRGADIIDIGGESTRPGAVRVQENKERERVVPVIEALTQRGLITSVDTMRASVAAAAAEAGVSMLNDVSGGLADPEMLSVAADTGLPICLMHWKADRFGDAAGAADHGGDVVADVHRHLDARVEAALEAGVKSENIILDPGLGFAKTAQDNWALLHALPSFIQRGHRVLLGASRKRFLAALRSSDEGWADTATAAVSAIAAQQGVWCVRVHDVAGSRDAVNVAQRWNEGA
ncbi:dihydropteroate synthase [Corynebacterium gerontici]|nr:dihydropteroate synthase [Corynebacterium gerontici]